MHFERSWSKGFALDPYVVRTALTPATRLIVISNAHNPSGAMSAREALEQLGVMAEAIGARVLVDEVYAEAQHDEALVPQPGRRAGRCVRLDQQPDQGVWPRRVTVWMDHRLAGDLGAGPRNAGRYRRQRAVCRRTALTDRVREYRSTESARETNPSENLAVVRAMAQSNPRLEWLEPAAGTTAFPRVAMLRIPPIWSIA